MRRPAPRIVLEAHDASGTTVARSSLEHGQDPVQVLARSGWSVVRVTEVGSTGSGEQVLTFRFLVRPAGGTSRDGSAEVGAGPPPAPGTPVRAGGAPKRHRVDLGRGALAREEPVPFQRVAAYAVVTSERGLLLTELSERTGRPGAWALPGGGLDPGEAPLDAALREVWEESGQEVSIDEVVAVTSDHFVGRAPRGRLEDFHAVRVIYRGHCEHPSEPVVHDVGGTTSAAAWVGPERLPEIGLTTTWRAVLAQLGLPT